MRLTAELINRSPSFINAVKDRELDLRGNRIAQIENLGVTRDGFDTIDFSDNQLTQLNNIPMLPRLKTLMVTNNRVSKICPTICASLPNLTSLVLTNNEVSQLDSIDSLAAAAHLESLCLLDNPITARKQYRLYIIYRLPQVRVLDYSRIKQREREESRAAFGEPAPIPSTTELVAAANKKRGVADAGDVSGGAAAKRARAAGGVGTGGLTQDEQEAIAKAIESATSIDEIRRLETALETGEFPTDLLIQQQQQQQQHQ